MANRARGETAVEIGGASYTISLCLGALAELEDAFQVESFEQALDFTKPSARRLRKFMAAVLKGNGVDVTPEVEAAIGQLDLRGFMTIVEGLMNASGMLGKPEAKDGVDSPLPPASAGESG